MFHGRDRNLGSAVKTIDSRPQARHDAGIILSHEPVTLVATTLE
jgi:hypothetical protein